MTNNDKEKSYFAEDQQNTVVFLSGCVKVSYLQSFKLEGFYQYVVSLVLENMKRCLTSIIRKN